jgi:hypothetical protein
LESRNDHVLDGARQHRAANRDDDEVRLGHQQLADLVDHLEHVLQAKAAVVVAGRADADQRHVPQRRRLRDSPQASLPDPSLNQVFQAGLDDRAPSFIDQ